MITSLRNSPSLRQCRSSLVTEMPPLAGGGGYTINLEDDNTVPLKPAAPERTVQPPACGGSLDDWSREGGLEVRHVLVLVLVVGAAGLLTRRHPCATRHADRAHRHRLADRRGVGGGGRGLWRLHLQRKTEGGVSERQAVSPLEMPSAESLSSSF